VGRYAARQIGIRLEGHAIAARSLLAREMDLAATADPFADRLGREVGVRVTVISAAGTVLGDSQFEGAEIERLDNHAGRPEVRGALARGSGRATRRSESVAEDLLYVAVRIDPADPSRGVLRLAVPLTEVWQARQEIRMPILLAGLVSIAAASLFGWLAARRPSRRLEEISRTASEFARGSAGPRAEVAGSDEVSDLARSLNRMADQLTERLGLLDRERNQLRTVLDGMVEGVLLTDAEGTVVLANRAFERIFDAASPVEGKRPLEVARIPALQEAVDSALAAQEPLTREILLGGAQEKAIRASLASLREAGRSVGAVAVFHDVSELKNLERVRREFVANVSHELRTPLTAIRGYAETLRDAAAGDPGQAAGFADVIYRHAGRLQVLIEDLLDLSSIEQGLARVALGPVPLEEVVTQAASILRPALARKRQELVLDLPPGLPSPRADRDRLSQVLINLMDNAVKFTPEGGRITVSAGAAGAEIVVSVRDSGVGIAPEELGRIFERFYRVDPSRERGEGGTGLGLAIAKHLTLAMGGRIEVESAPGAGTTFRVSLPAA
jgi:two-component system phosphate regulon sensor histidine kinase PhoR